MRIRRILLGITGCYLIKCDDYGYVLVDAGEPGMAAKFRRVMSHLRIDLTSIRLIIITHAHYDHVGSLALIKEWCGCPVLIHPLEAVILEEAQVVIPPGTNRLGSVFSRIGTQLKPFMKFPPAQADILVSDHYDLSAFGLAGQVVSSPGHTLGSLSVLLESGEAMVGDLAMNFLFRSTFPILAEDKAQVMKSRDMVKSSGVEWIYPAHGKSFAVSCL